MLLCGRQVAGVGEAEGRNDIALRVDLKRQAGDALHQRTERDEVLVAVAEDNAGRRDGRGLEETAQTFLSPVPWAGEVEIWREAGVVGEAVADGDVLLAVGAELGHVMSDGIVDANLALLVELHYGRGSDEVLGERGHVEDGVLGHRLARGLQRAHAVGAVEDDLAVVPNDDDGAGQFVVRDGIVDDRVDGREGRGRCCLQCNCWREVLRGACDGRRDEGEESNDDVAPVAGHAAVALSGCGSSRLAM